jgi:hypothetical protein
LRVAVAERKDDQNSKGSEVRNRKWRRRVGDFPEVVIFQGRTRVIQGAPKGGLVSDEIHSTYVACLIQSHLKHGGVTTRATLLWRDEAGVRYS